MTFTRPKKIRISLAALCKSTSCASAERDEALEAAKAVLDADAILAGKHDLELVATIFKNLVKLDENALNHATETILKQTIRPYKLSWQGFDLMRHYRFEVLLSHNRMIEFEAFHRLLAATHRLAILEVMLAKYRDKATTHDHTFKLAWRFFGYRDAK